MKAVRANTVIEGRLGTYQLLERIGKGGYGVVYKGIWRQTGKHVAVKRVSRYKITKQEEDALQSEIDLLKTLKNNYIVNYIEAVESRPSNSPAATAGGEQLDPKVMEDMKCSSISGVEDTLDIVMEYIEGGSLEKLVQEVKKGLDPGTTKVLDEQLVAKFTKQILHGLVYLHEQGIMHRDIKGANILITKESFVKLTDFGVSSSKPVMDCDNDAAMDVVGTPYWMAPEIISLQGYSTASDIWSVGCTVIELLTGDPPYAELNALSALFRIASDERPPLPADISPELELFLQECFHKDMNSRSTAKQLLKHKWILMNTESQPNSTQWNEKEDNDWLSDKELSSEHPIRAKNSELLKNFQETEEDEFFEDFDDLEGDFVSNPSILKSTENIGTDFEAFEDIYDPVAENEKQKIQSLRKIRERVKQCVQLLEKEDKREIAAQTLIEILTNNPEQRIALMSDPGILAVLGILESSELSHNLEEKLLNTLVLIASIEEEELQHYSEMYSAEISFAFSKIMNLKKDMALAGCLVSVLKYCSDSYPLSIRLAAAKFIQLMCRSDVVVQMLIACKGLYVFGHLLEADLDQFYELSTICLECIGKVFDSEQQRYKRDLCKRFAKMGLLQKIANAIEWVAKQAKQNYPSYNFHLLNLIKLLKTFSERADPYLKIEVSRYVVMEPIISSMPFLDKESLGLILQSINDITRDPQTHIRLQQVQTVSTLVEFLSDSRITDRMQYNIISSIYNLCIVSPLRREKAAEAGIIPHLQRFIRSNEMSVKSWSVDIYSVLGQTSSKTRAELWKYNGVEFYFELLNVHGLNFKWKTTILQSLADWLEHEKSFVEAVFVMPENLEVFESLFSSWSFEDREGLLMPYGKMMALSKKLSHIMSRESVIKAMIFWLEDAQENRPRVRLLLIRILETKCQVSDQARTLASIFNLKKTLEKLTTEDPAITVQQRARDLISLLDQANGSKGV